MSISLSIVSDVSPITRISKSTTITITTIAWWSFFIAFFIWFAIAPLLPMIKRDLNLSTQQIWTTNIAAVAFDVCMRFVFGALCDKYGARIPMGVVLMLASIPTALIGLVNSFAGLVCIRLFIGLAGSTFVMCQCWTTRYVFTFCVCISYVIIFLYLTHHMYLYLECSPKKSVDWQMDSLGVGVTLEVSDPRLCM